MKPKTEADRMAKVFYLVLIVVIAITVLSLFFFTHQIDRMMMCSHQGMGGIVTVAAIILLAKRWAIRKLRNLIIAINDCKLYIFKS